MLIAQVLQQDQLDGGPFLAHLAGHLAAIFPGTAQVQQQHIRLADLAELDGFRAAARLAHQVQPGRRQDQRNKATQVDGLIRGDADAQRLLFCHT